MGNPQPAGEAPTILHVEDRETNRHLRRRLLERAGFRVIEAATAAEGVAVAVEHQPDVVVTDISLPDLSGFELTSRLKTDPGTANIRVVQISAVFTDAASRVRGLNSGADAFLIDPVDSAELVAVIHAVLRGRRTEDRLQVTAEALRVSEQQLKFADRQKDAFIATVVHELRQPLAPIMTALELLQRTDNPDTMRHAHRVLERQVNQMRRLIDDLLDAARIAQGKVTIRLERIGLAEIVKGAVNTVLPLARDRRQELRLQLPSEPVVVDADPDRLQQVLSNLLTNAVKFTGPEGRIAVTVERADGSVAIRVSDTGRGIDPEHLPHIFNMFTQSSTDEGGLGVGLAVVRGLVERHGGTVNVHSEGTGKGAEFTVRLPVPEA